MRESLYKTPFEVEPDANVFDAKKLDTTGMKSLIANIIYYSVHDAGMELYKRQLGCKRNLRNKRLVEAMKFFKSHLYEDYAEFIGFRLSGDEVIELLRKDPAKCLDLHSRAAVERRYREELEQNEKYGPILDSENDRDPYFDGCTIPDDDYLDDEDDDDEDDEGRDE